MSTAPSSVRPKVCVCVCVCVQLLHFICLCNSLKYNTNYIVWIGIACAVTLVCLAARHTPLQESEEEVEKETQEADAAEVTGSVWFAGRPDSHRRLPGYG